MATQVRSLPRFTVGVVALLVLAAGCTPKVTAPPEPPYSVRRGDEAFRYQDYKGAITSYRGYLDESQKDAYTARVFYKTALAEYRLGRYEDTLETLHQLQQRYPKGHWVQVDALRGDAERELERPMAALKAWDEAWSSGNENDHRKLRQRIVVLTRGFTDTQLAQAQRVVENEEVRALLEQQIAVRQPPGIEEPIPEGEALVGEEGGLAEPATPPSHRAVQTKEPYLLPPSAAAERAAQPTVESRAAAPARVEAAAPKVPTPQAVAAVRAPEPRAPEPLAPEPAAPALPPEGKAGKPTAPVRAMLSPPVGEAAPLAAAEHKGRQPAAVAGQPLAPEPAMPAAQEPEALAGEALAPEPPVPSLHPERGGGAPNAPARPMLSPPVGEAAPLPVAGRTGARQPETKQWGQLRIGCLLPLSGPSQEVGTRALRGLRMLFGENSDRLVVLDTGSDAATALQRFNQLSRNPDVVAVVGPLRNADAEAVAPAARQVQLPLFLLSQRDGLAGGPVVQVGATRSRLVESVVQYAMDKIHMRRFGVLYPTDDVGKQDLTTFRSAAERRGGTIVGADGYSARTLVLPTVTVKRWHNAQHLQAIFLPDNAMAAQAVARYLQQDMPDITLLGVSDWGALVSDGNAAASGILFSDGFYSGSTRPGTQQFVGRFQQAYGEQPGAVEAQAYDAGLLIRSALDAGARSRAEVLPALQAYGPIDGATGRLTVTGRGLESRLFLLQVYNGKVQEVSGGAS